MSRKHRAEAVKALSAKSGPDDSQVSFRVRRLENSLVWALVAFTVWSCAVLGHGSLIAWMIAGLTAFVGAWCRVKPALHESLLFVRGALLLAGGFVLQATASDAAGAAGPFFIWPVMVVTGYSLMLSARWTLPLWTLAAVEFVAARLYDHATPAWSLTLAQAGVLVFFAYAAREFGHSVRQLDIESEALRKDPNSRLYNEAGFFDHGAKLFDECRGRKRDFTLVLLNSSDLREIAELAGKRAANQLFQELVQRMAAVAIGQGLAARTDSVEFALALPGVGATRAAQLLHQSLGQPPKVEVTLKGKKISLMLHSLIAEVTPDVPTLEDMYDRMRAKLQRRAGEAPTQPDMQSTLQGVWEGDASVPHDLRSTMPMAT